MRPASDASNCDKPYLESLFKAWGMDKLEIVTRYPRTAIYQWRPSRTLVPAEAALRVCELAQSEGYYVEKLCPGLPWQLLYGGRDRRKSYDGLADTSRLEDVIKEIGVTAVARAAGHSRQNVYNAMNLSKCPVWLALAIEEASGQRYLAEDFRPELPWWPLYAHGRKDWAGEFTRSERDALCKPKSVAMKETKE
jgi:DNA-binding transcriptional regulator YdaS (Cro superfamily)